MDNAVRDTGTLMSPSGESSSDEDTGQIEDSESPFHGFSTESEDSADDYDESADSQTPGPSHQEPDNCDVRSKEFAEILAVVQAATRNVPIVPPGLPAPPMPPPQQQGDHYSLRKTRPRGPPPATK